MLPQCMTVVPPMLIQHTSGVYSVHAILDYGDDRPQRWIAATPDGVVRIFMPTEVRFPRRQLVNAAEPPAVRFADEVYAGDGTRPPMGGSELLTRIVAWMERFREARAGESRYSKVFHELASEVNGLLADLLAGEKVDVAKYRKALTGAGRMAEMLLKMREYLTNVRKHAGREPMAAAVSLWETNSASWLAELDAVLNHKPAAEDVGTLARAG